MRHCLECGIDITNRGNRAGLCFSCQKKYRKDYQENYQNEYHKFNPNQREQQVVIGNSGRCSMV